MRSCFNFIQSVVRRIIDDGIIAQAYQLTYGLLIAAFPFTIFLFTLLGYMSLDPDILLSTLQQYLPDQIFTPIAEIIDDVVGKQHGGLLSLSIVLAIWSASSGFRVLMRSLNLAFDCEHQRPFWKQVLLSVAWVILFSVFVMFAFLCMVFGNFIIDLLEQWAQTPLVGTVGRVFLTMLLPFALLFLLLIFMYRFIPAEMVPMRTVLVAALFTTAVWIAFTFGFRLYAAMFMNYSRFYGALGSVIGLLFWLLATSMILMIGAVVAQQWRDSTVLKDTHAAPPVPKKS